MDKKTMLKPFQELSNRGFVWPIQGAVFFTFFYLYLWLEVDLRFIYHGGGIIRDFPIFFRGWAFFMEFTSYPGGLVEYLSAFLAQFFYYSWAGALVVTLQAWFIYACVATFIKAMNAHRFHLVCFIPPTLLLVLYTRYTYYFANTTALFVALVFVSLYLKITPKNKLMGLVLFVFLSVILYTIAGGAYLLFAVLCAIYELFFRQRLKMCIGYLLTAALVSYVEGVFIFDMSINDSFGGLLSFSSRVAYDKNTHKMRIIIYMLYLFLPVVSICLGCWRKSITEPSLSVGKPNTSKRRLKRNRKKKRRSKLSKSGTGLFSWNTCKPVFSRLIKSCLPFVIAGATVLFAHNNALKTYFAVDYYADHHIWKPVLAAARRYHNNLYLSHTAYRALYHTNRLPYEMFSYATHLHALLLTTPEFLDWRKKFNIFIELGLMNLAEHAMIQSLEYRGEHPTTLKRLALVNMVKGDTDTAKVYLKALSKTLFHGDWADNYLHRLTIDPELSTDKQIQRLRSRMLEEDYSFSSIEPDGLLSDLLKKNRYNQMAFEYQMALYMLTCELDKVVNNLSRLDDFGYNGIPKLYEEALLLHMYNTKKRIDLHGRQISFESHQRFEDFLRILMGYGLNRKAALNDLAKNYSDSYYFYHIYRFSGARK